MSEPLCIGIVPKHSSVHKQYTLASHETFTSKEANNRRNNIKHRKKSDDKIILKEQNIFRPVLSGRVVRMIIMVSKTKLR